MSDTAVPLLDLQLQYAPLRASLLDAMTRVADSQRFIGGPEVESFEREIAAQLEVEHAIGMSSGTDAILAALMALGIGPGDEVVTSTYSFFATAGCIARVGATPVLVDIDPTTFNLDTAAAIRAIGPRTKAMIPVHLYGQMADMQPLISAASSNRIAIIEDACQSIGAKYQDRPSGAWGLAACFSFFPSKNLGAFGDGGLATTNDAAFARELRLMRAHGSERRYYHEKIGANFRLDALQAAILRVKAPHLGSWTEARRRNADIYRDLFAETGLDTVVTLPVVRQDCFHIYNQFVIRAERRDELRAFLDTRKIGTEVYYPVPFHLQECFKSLGYAPGDFPEAERAAAETLALPVYGELTSGQLGYVVNAVRDFYGGQ
ncbi:MAG: DegT/DnrJ/EryC1/StrS family aminotransferase [Acidobacteriota bacterium]|nr:DegT/DnrJ/EryC1/StrS family aminotransferase [Acidobacteriota bacterium]